jgi:hypothetical protein
LQRQIDSYHRFREDHNPCDDASGDCRLPCSIALHTAVTNPHPVTGTQIDFSALQDGLMEPLIHTHGYALLIRWARLLLLAVLDLMPDIGTAGRTHDGCRRTPASGPDLVADQPANDSPGHGSDTDATSAATARRFRPDQLYRLHGAIATPDLPGPRMLR